MLLELTGIAPIEISLLFQHFHSEVYEKRFETLFGGLPFEEGLVYVEIAETKT